jgi:hypothetical protein
MDRNMSRPIPGTVTEWFKEITLAIADAREAKSFGELIGELITDANLFHLAPVVCLKFRGRKLVGREATRVTETALANYVVNSDPDGVDHGLESKALLAFAVCYLTAHLTLDPAPLPICSWWNGQESGSWGMVIKHRPVPRKVAHGHRFPRLPRRRQLRLSPLGARSGETGGAGTVRVAYRR